MSRNDGHCISGYDGKGEQRQYYPLQSVSVKSKNLCILTTLDVSFPNVAMKTSFSQHPIRRSVVLTDIYFRTQRL